MIQIKETDVYGWGAAIRGMRNPMNSWDKSDTIFGLGEDRYGDMEIGKNDLNLMKKLSRAGSDHSKFLRMINVTADITAPRYWWIEYATYKIGTVENSCSTMHKIHDKEFVREDFSTEYFDNDEIDIFDMVISSLNWNREKFLETKDKSYWCQMIQLLPQSYNQKRTVQLNYQVLKNMYHARKNHKLDEWREFCKWCETLPYFKEVCIGVTE